MTEEEAKELLKRITYKPSYLFSIVTHSTDRLRITWSDVDSNSGKKQFMCYEEIIYLAPMNASDLVHRLLRMLLAMAQHETCEFLKLDGIAPFNPHLDVFELVKVQQNAG